MLHIPSHVLLGSLINFNSTLWEFLVLGWLDLRGVRKRWRDLVGIVN